jgi:hypothetical protein
MDTNRTAVIVLLASRRAVRAFAAIVVVGCLTVTGLVAAVHGAGAASGIQSEIVSVNRTNKGDRLPLLPDRTSKASPIVTTLSRPPIGCESAFSLAADPKRSHIFGRCIS